MMGLDCCLSPTLFKFLATRLPQVRFTDICFVFYSQITELWNVWLCWDTRFFGALAAVHFVLTLVTVYWCNAAGPGNVIIFACIGFFAMWPALRGRQYVSCSQIHTINSPLFWLTTSFKCERSLFRSHFFSKLGYFAKSLYFYIVVNICFWQL